MPTDEFYKVRELAKRLKVTDQAIYNWIQAGKITTVRFGRTQRIPAAEVERVIREGIPEVSTEKLTPGIAQA